MFSKVNYYIILFLLPNVSWSFYVPGVAPVEFKRGSLIDVKAVKMTSTHTQLPYEYYSLPFCAPKNGTFIYKSENLGEVLRGDRIVNTPYEVRMAEDISCRLLCHSPNNPMNWSREDSLKVIDRIQLDYCIHLLVDNLPVATKLMDLEKENFIYLHGYRLGGSHGDKKYINNHLRLILHYHTQDEEIYRVVGFEAEVSSVASSEYQFSSDGTCQIPDGAKPQFLNHGGSTSLYFTYGVQWKRSDVSWASRWDTYLAMTDAKIHWFSIVNSLVAVFFLSGLLTLVMLRTVRRDIARYNIEAALDDPSFDETGWKLVHGDVFRPPRNPRLLSALVGTGIQIFLMVLITLFLAMLGMLSPASRGALMTAAILLYVLMGLVAGYFAARLYKTLRGRQWKRAAFLTATLYPSCLFGVCFVLNLLVWGKASSGAVPFATIVKLLLLWFGISLPLVFLGFYFGYRKQAIQHPVRTNQIPRQVPEQPWYTNPVLCTLMAGVLPFAAVFIELYFIFTALWQNQFYYMFGFLFLVFVILAVSCSHIAVVLVYLQLCAEDYRWWWRSFIVSGGSAIYVLLYSVLYFFTKLEISEVVPSMLYAGYSCLMAFTYWLLTATIGFVASYAFVHKMYSSVKTD